MTTSTALSPFVAAFVANHPTQAARALETLGKRAIAAKLGECPTPVAARLLRHLTATDAVDAMVRLERGRAARLLEALDPSVAARLVARLDAAIREDLLAGVAPAAAREIRGLLSYPPGTAGYSMDARVVALPIESTAAEALAKVVELGARLSEIPVVDRDGNLAGTVALTDLVSADGATPASTLLVHDAIRATDMAPHEQVVELLARHRLRSLPVVDADGQLVGVLRHDALVRAARADAAADMQQMVGAGAQERALSPAAFAVRSRLPWLQINLLTAFLASAVVGLFEDTIARITALAVLLPVAAGQSGNTGAQALAVTMRSLALREIRTAHVWRVLRKEGAVGFVNGIAVGVASAIGVWVWSHNLPLAALMGVAMIGSMFIASMAGAIIPTVLSALGRDPATASSIILTTVTDVVGFFMFLGLATLFADALIGG